MKLTEYGKKNTEREFEFMQYDDVVKLASYGHVWFYSQQKDARRAKITSIKTWKKRPDIEIGLKYGMYEYHKVVYTPHNNPELLLKEI